MGRAKVTDAAIGELISALRRLEGDLGVALKASAQELRQAIADIDAELRSRERRLQRARTALDRARADLDACRRSQPPRDCSAAARAVQAAERELSEAATEHRKAVDARGQLREVEKRYGQAAARARSHVLAKIPAAVSSCRRAMSDVAAYSDSSGVTVTPGSSSPVAAIGGAEAVRSAVPASAGGDLGSVEWVDLSRVDSSDGNVTGPESFEKLSWGDAQWSANALASVVGPAVAQGKGRDYFVERDRREGRSGARSYTRTYDGYFGSDTAIKLSQRPDGTLTVTNGYHRIWSARQAGLSRIPARVRR